MDNKFLEEAEEIVDKFGAVFSFPAFVTDANGHDQKKGLLYKGRWENRTLVEVIAKSLLSLSLSSKHKEDLRALIAAIKSCEPPSEDGRAKSEKLALAGAGADVMKERVLIAVASTLKERGISL